jgi:RNA polymerase primary sigma factor
MLTEAEEGELSCLIRQGDRGALRRMVQCNLRFVVAVARNYQHQGLPLEDLIAEGNWGLIQAARRFDGSRSYKFISYAVWWIRQAIVQAIANQSHTIRQPVANLCAIRAAGKAQRALEQRLGRSPDLSEVAQEAKTRREKIEEALNARAACASLDSPIEADEQCTLHDIVGSCEEMPDRDLTERAFHAALDDTLHGLEEREEEIVRLYFGIDDIPECTLDQIGRRCHISSERVRQVKQRALRKLRRYCRSRDLKGAAA